MEGTEEDSAMSEASVDQLPSPIGPLCSYGPRLAFTYFKGLPNADDLNERSEHCHFFTVDNALTYLSFYQDWGPLNVAMFYRFSLHLHGLLESKELAKKKLILYSSDAHDKKANAALMIACYAMIVQRWTVAEALYPISSLELRPFRDAGYARADFHLSVQDCLFGIKKAVDLRLLRLDEFDVKEYEHYEKVENGDWNMRDQFITPHFLAFASPVEANFNASAAAFQKDERIPDLDSSKLSKPFRNVLEQFEKKNVKMVIRLNKKLYNKQHFTDRGLQHIEMFFEDGTNPTMDMCREFIDISDHIIKQGGVVAVHCKAGLGRTGTLIGAYMIYKWGFTSNEAIAFQRFMRPGCVVGPQQHYLYSNQHVWIRWAALDQRSPVARSLPNRIASATSNIVRPETPPSETDVSPDAASTSPGKARGHVPGQPRKTPGAKSRHAIALPETNDESGDPSEELMLVKTTDTPAGNGRPEEMEIDVAASQQAHVAMTAQLRQDPDTSTSSVAATVIEEDAAEDVDTSRAPSRILVPTAVDDRPLSTTPIPPLSPGTPSSVPRSKAIKNLGVYSDRPAPRPSLSPPAERYNLRANRAVSQTTVPLSRTTSEQSNTNSPSKLPTRIPPKRRGASGKGAPAVTQVTPQEVPDVFGPVSILSGSPAKSTRSAHRKRRNSVAQQMQAV